MFCAQEGWAHPKGFAALLLAALLACVPVRAIAGLTALSGHVTSHLTGAPLQGVRVGIEIDNLLMGGGTFIEVGAAYTDADGFYTWTGDCESIFSVCTVVVVDPPYLPASGSFDANAGTAVVDLALITPATASGTVRFPGGDATGMRVTAERLAESGFWDIVSSGAVGADGAFVIGALPPDTYRFCTERADNGAIQQCFDHVDMPPVAVDPDATLVDVAEGTAVDGIDFDLVFGSTLSGTVYDAFLGEPLVLYPAEAIAYDINGTPRMGASAGATGEYHLRGLPDGSYYVGAYTLSVFADDTQFFPAIVCNANACPPPTSGTLFVISGGSEILGIDFEFHPDVVVQGRVLDAASGTGLGDVEVGTYQTDGAQMTVSAPDTGDYTFYWYSDKPFEVGAFYAPPHINAVYPGASCLRGLCVGEITPLMATTGSVLTGIDLPMQLGAVISGSPRRADNGVPGDAYIELYDAQFNEIWNNFSIDGVYATDAWLPGTYYIEATGLYPLSGCAFYDDRPCPQNGGNPAGVDPTPITVAAGEIRTGIDFHLMPVDAIFAGDFEFEFGAPVTPATPDTRSP